MPTYSIDGPDGKTYSIDGPAGATKDQVIAKIKERQQGYQTNLKDAVTGIPSEIASTFMEGVSQASPFGLGEDAAKKGVIASTMEAPGKAMGALKAAGSPIIGTLKSLIGHPMADLTHAVGSFIAPETAKKDTHEDIYGKTREDVETALSAVRPGRVPGVVGPTRTGPLGDSFSNLKRASPSINQTVEDQAINKIMSRIEQDKKAGGASAQEMIDRVNSSDKPLTLTDIGGENIKGLAGNVLRAPGPGRQYGREFLTNRDEMAAARLSNDINKYVSGGPGMFQATENLLKARSVAAKEPYENFFKMQNVWSDRLHDFVKDPVFTAGLKKGFEIERLRALAEGRPITATQLGVDMDTEGNIRMLDVPNTRLLHMAKVGMDGLIADERNEITGRLTSRGVALNQVQKAYVGELDSLSKDTYAAARKTWSGPSASMDAIREGRSIFNRSPDTVAAEVKRIEKESPSDLEFYKIGVADLMRERLTKSGFNSDESKSMVRNPWMRAQLKPIFKTEAEFNAFVDSVADEKAMFDTKQKLVGGSPTAERGVEDSQGTKMAEHGVATAASAVTGHWFHAARNAYRMWKDLGLKPNPELNQKIAEILFATPINKQDKAFEGLMKGVSLPNKSIYHGDARYMTPAARNIGLLTQEGSSGSPQTK